MNQPHPESLREEMVSKGGVIVTHPAAADGCDRGADGIIGGIMPASPPISAAAFLWSTHPNVEELDACGFLSAARARRHPKRAGKASK